MSTPWQEKWCLEMYICHHRILFGWIICWVLSRFDILNSKHTFTIHGKIGRLEIFQKLRYDFWFGILFYPANSVIFCLTKVFLFQQNRNILFAFSSVYSFLIMQSRILSESSFYNVNFCLFERGYQAAMPTRTFFLN